MSALYNIVDMLHANERVIIIVCKYVQGRDVINQAIDKMDILGGNTTGIVWLDNGSYLRMHYEDEVSTGMSGLRCHQLYIQKGCNIHEIANKLNYKGRVILFNFDFNYNMIMKGVV